ncbi:active breakpoint cluster region-related protein-like [Protopterus annectens]|uniref:active breakpoint cluster region-related protein-like n=1 Tax=Protopterus annectens TaxID=7888 RepID=UPI001CFBA82B|nr:active breakpoint cluster region-related protein-like [Protopterus annectens]
MLEVFVCEDQRTVNILRNTEMDLFYEAAHYLQSKGIEVAEYDAENDEDQVFSSGFSEELTFEENHFVQSRSSDSSERTCSTELLCEGEIDSETLLEKRMQVLTNVQSSEGQYVSELQALMVLMKPLHAAANTSQPVLTSEQIQTIFFQVPEIHAIHKEFYTKLCLRLELNDPNMQVGDLFEKLVNQLGVYNAFLDNLETATAVAQRSTQADERFKNLAEKIKPVKDSETVYTLNELLHMPVQRVTKTLSAMHDVLKFTPEEHSDCPLLNEAVRISNNFLSGINQTIPPKRASVTVSKATTRQVVKDGFVVDVTDDIRRLRHIFLFTDLLLCAKLKEGKQPLYKLEWHIPMRDLRVAVASGPFPTEPQEIMDEVRRKIFQARMEIQQAKHGDRFLMTRVLERVKKRLRDNELWLLKHSPTIPLMVSSRNGKSYTLLLSSEYELSQWMEQIEKLSSKSKEGDTSSPSPYDLLKLTSSSSPSPYDLLKLTSSIMKLRMMHTLPLHSITDENDNNTLCGTLSVLLHSARGFSQPEDVYSCLEVDCFGYFEKKAQTEVEKDTCEPCWEEEFNLEVDGAQSLRVLCCKHSNDSSADFLNTILWKTEMQLDPKALQVKEWKRTVLQSNGIEVLLSLRYQAHQLQPPAPCSVIQKEVFGVLIEEVAKREGVQVPYIVRHCVQEVDSRGLEEVGIYRVSGVATEVQALKIAYSANIKEALVKLKVADIHAVAGILKLYFRTLPQPLLTHDLYLAFCRGIALTDPVAKATEMLSLLKALPEVNLNTFLFLVEHLKRVSSKETINKMTSYNLATVFGPTLLQAPPMGNMQAGSCKDISQEIVVQVQVLMFYLQYTDLPKYEVRKRSYSTSVET